MAYQSTITVKLLWPGLNLKCCNAEAVAKIRNSSRNERTRKKERVNQGRGKWWRKYRLRRLENNSNHNQWTLFHSFTSTSFAGTITFTPDPFSQMSTAEFVWIQVTRVLQVLQELLFLGKPKFLVLYFFTPKDGYIAQITYNPIVSGIGYSSIQVVWYSPYT